MMKHSVKGQVCQKVATPKFGCEKVRGTKGEVIYFSNGVWEKVSRCDIPWLSLDICMDPCIHQLSRGLIDTFASLPFSSTFLEVKPAKELSILIFCTELGGNQTCYSKKKLGGIVSIRPRKHT